MTAPGSLRHCRALLHETRDDALDQRDLGVFETLEAPAIELEAKHVVVARESRFDHLQDTGLPRAPVAMDTDRDGVIRLLAQQSDDRRRNRFVVEQINPVSLSVRITLTSSTHSFCSTLLLLHARAGIRALDIDVQKLPLRIRKP